MSELSKQALKVENNTSFPNNNSGLITPQILRDFNIDMIDSLVDEIGYTADSASWNQQIDALEQFTASAATSAITASSLVTASVAGNVITFTKGNASTFNITVATGSGGGGDVTALNAFTASQLDINSGYNTFTQSANTSISNLNAATASYVTETESGSFLLTASFDNNTRNLTFTKGNNTTFNVNIPDVSGSVLPTGVISGSAQISALGFVSSSVTASSLITASAAGATITFTKGDNTQFSVTVATGSFISASYAETASYSQFAQDIYLNVKNTTGAQLNKGTVVRIIGATGDNALVATASYVDDNNSANTLGFLYENIANDSFGKVITQGTLLGIDTDPVLGYTAGQILYLSSSGQYTNVKPPAPYHEVRLGQVLRAQQNNGSMYVLIQNGYELEELHDVDINTGSLANNNLLAYNSATLQWENKTLTQVGATTTASFNQYTSSNDQKVDSLIARTGSYATTGSNSFTGIQTLVDGTNFSSIVPTSGSLMLVAKSFTSSSLHLTSSFTNSVNLIFKNNDNTADTIISGSNNIFLNPTAPPAGFKRYIGNNNIAIAAGFPTISGSMGFSPAVNNNYFVGGITMRGPVSASAWTITGNNILGSVLIGTGVTTHAQGLTSGLALTSNVIAGTVGIVANQTSFTGSQTAVSTNIIPGTSILTLNQSAAQLALNVINDANFALTNNYFSQSAGLGQVSVLRNNILGQSNSIIVTGSQPAGTTNAPNYNDNFIGGASNTIFADASTARVSGTTAYHSAARNIIFGQNLIVSASSATSDTTGLGSAFFGRFNDVNGSKDLTAETIFAVGTGTSTSNRKTGFLIDSGSNTFVEGTLNVSGSSSFTGAVNITGSLLVNGTSLVINTGSFATTGSNTFVGDQTVNADLIISASKALRFGGNGDIQTGTGNSITQFNGSYGLYIRNFTTNQFQIEQNAPSEALRIRNTGGGLIQISGSQTTIQDVDFIPFSASLNSRINAFATTGSNAFFGTNSFSGAVSFTGSAPSILSSSFSGSLITNLTDTYVDVPAVQQIVTLTSASYAGLASGSLLNPNTLYVVSGSIPTQTINTGSFATTGSNNFIGNQVITGSLILSSSAVTELTVIGNTILSGNLDIQSTLSASLQQGYVWVGDALGRTTTVATSSFGGGGGGAAFPFTGSAQITGSLGVTGSFSGFVNNLSISSNTASMDFNNGNFFTLQLVSGSITHLTATNIRPGQTINLLVQTDSGSASASGSLTFSPTFKFAGGFDYTPTAITASKDIVSFVTFNTTEIFAGQIKNLS